VTSVSVCSSVCSSVCKHVSRTMCLIFTNFFVHVIHGCSSGGIVIRYVFLVSWITIIFAHNGPYGSMSMSIQRVTSLCCCAQTNTSAALYRMMAGTEAR